MGITNSYCCNFCNLVFVGNNSPMITVNIKLFYFLVIFAIILFFAWVVQFDEIRSLEKKINTMQLEQDYNNMFTFITEGN